MQFGVWSAELGVKTDEYTKALRDFLAPFLHDADDAHTMLNESDHV